MGLDSIHLRKVLRLILMKENLRSTAIKADARAEMKRRDEGASPGGDFHVPFWSAAKGHASGRLDLNVATDDLIEKNWRRTSLYPRLRDGFLNWWGQKRRWINEDIAELPKTVKASVGFADIEGTVKVENMLCLRIGQSGFRYIYPYFADKPQMSAEVARLGLWVMSQALPTCRLEDMRILDVIRGEVFSVDRHPFRGNEEEIFTLAYRRILREWREHFR